jgi:hypothetical protein
MSEFTRKGYAGLDGALGLIDAYLNADGDTDIDLRLGEGIGRRGIKLIVVTVGVKSFGLEKHEAEKMADICEDTMRRYGDKEQLSTLTIALRHAASQI